MATLHRIRNRLQVQPPLQRTTYNIPLPQHISNSPNPHSPFIALIMPWGGHLYLVSFYYQGLMQLSELLLSLLICEDMFV